MKIKIDISGIDFLEAEKKLHSDEMWLFAAKEWHRIYKDLVPHDTGMLRDNVKYFPKRIEHTAPYASFIYYGVKMVDPQLRVGGLTGDGGITWFSRPGVKKQKTREYLNLKNGCREWDAAAVSKGRALTLAKSMQNWIDQKL